MNKAKWKAVYAVVDEYGFYSVSDVLTSLKNCGAIAEKDKWSDIGRNFDGYDDLRSWLEDNIF